MQQPVPGQNMVVGQGYYTNKQIQQAYAARVGPPPSRLLSCRFSFYKSFACVLGAMQWLMLTIALAGNYWFQSSSTDIPDMPSDAKIYGGFFSWCSSVGGEENCEPLNSSMKTDQWSTATYLVLFSVVLLVAGCICGFVSCALLRKRMVAVVTTTLFGFATLFSVIGYLQVSSQISDWGVKPSWGENDLYKYKLQQGWCAYVCAGSVVFGIFAPFLMALGAWKDTGLSTGIGPTDGTVVEEQEMEEIEEPAYQTGVPAILQN